MIPNGYNVSLLLAHSSSINSKVLGSTKKPRSQRSLSWVNSDNGSSDDLKMDKSMLKASDTPDT